MFVIEKCPKVCFHDGQFVLAATPFNAYHNLLSQLLKVVHTSTSCYHIIFSSYRQKTVYATRNEGDYPKITSLLLKVVYKSLWV